MSARWRSPILRLALGQAALVLVAFVLLAGAAYVTLDTLTDRVMQRALDQEISDLSDWHAEAGPQGLEAALADRAAANAPDMVYLLRRDERLRRVPVVPALTPDLLARPGWRTLTLPLQGREREVVVRVVAFGDGSRLLVGHVAWERERLRASLWRALGLGLLLAVLVAAGMAWAMSRAVAQALAGPLAVAERFADGALDARAVPNASGDGFDRLAQALNAMFARIQELVGGIAHTTDALAHDLRTPLARLRARLEAARTATPDPGAAAALDDALAETDRLLDTFGAILRLARLEADTPPPATVIDLEVLVRDAVELFEAVAESRGQRLAVDTQPVQVAGDRDQLFQLLANLLDNAIKYGPEGGTLGLSLASAGDAARLVVSDAGPGIAEADRERVFDRFVRLEAHRGSSGNGLGLALVRAIVRHHGGRIRLEDARPGLRVEVLLPLRQP